MFDALVPSPSDELLALIGLHHNDPRPHKLDLGVGVYRNEHGATPVFEAIKAAERSLIQEQTSKSYLGPEGDVRFVELLAPIALGDRHATSSRLAGIQTPGGGGALRLASELIAASTKATRVWVGTPTWPNHVPVLKSAGLDVATYTWFDPITQSTRFERMVEALNNAKSGDVVLLHGCCHNPTGADLTPTEWEELATILNRRGLLPFIDLAYQGLGRGLEPDALGLRRVLDAVDEAIVAYSCDKNFGLYRERVGALFAVARNAHDADLARGTMAMLARVNWSMPPDHGAATVRIVLDTSTLRASWLRELDGMRARLQQVRSALAASLPLLSSIAGQNGLFALLSLSKAQIAKLREEHAIYMAGSGRINLAGLKIAAVEQFTRALADVGAFDTGRKS